MSQGDKAQYWQALKGLGVEFERHYRDYTTKELEDAYAAYVAAGQAPPIAEAPVQEPVPPTAGKPSTPADHMVPPPPGQQDTARPAASAPVARRDPDEMAGMRQNTHDELTPLRTDPDTGYIWYQEEVQKPGYAKPRGRRLLKYRDSGFKTERATSGEYTEEFEVAGDQRRESEARITLPSYQVGIYVDPRFPMFKIHVYGDQTGFDLFDVENYFGGPEHVPDEVKRTYVESSLCYDVRTTVRWIEAEFRRLQLAGKV